MIKLQGLRARLALLIVLSFSPVMALTVYWSYRDQQQRLAEVNAAELRAAQQIATTYGQIFRSTRDTLLTLVQSYEVRNLDTAECSLMIANLLPHYPQYLNLVVVDINGKVFCDNRPHPVTANVKNFASFAQVLATQSFAVGSMEVGQTPGEEFFAPANPVLDSHGKLRAVAVAIMNMDYLKQVGAQTKLATGVSLTVFDRSGRIIVRRPDSPKNAKAPTVDAETSDAIVRGETQTISVSADGTRRHFAMAAVDGIPAPAALYVGIGVDPQSTLAPLRAALYRDLAFLAGIALLAIGLAWIAVERSIIRRVNTLLASMRRIATGKLDTREKASGGPIELQQLAQGFDSMADALQKHERERNRTEEILRQARAAAVESEQNLAITLNSIGDAVIATDANGNITRMNPTAARMTGWTLAQAAGRPLGEVFHIINVQTRAPAVDPVQLVMERGEIVGLANHTALIARDGREYQIFDSAAPIRDPDGHIAGVVLVFSDVTETYRIEAERAKLAAIVENSNDAIYSRALDGTITSWNSGMTRLFGYTAAQALGKSITITLATGAPPHFQTVNERALHSELMTYEADRVTKDGRMITVVNSVSPIRDSAGNLVGISGIMQDVTALRQAQTALRDSEARFRATFEQAAVGIAHIEVGTSTILMTNARFCSLLGYDRNELTGIHSRRLAPANDVAPRDMERARLIAGVIEVSTAERSLIRKDGTAQWFNRSLSLVRDSAGKPSYFISVIEDISERMKADQALRAAEQRFHDLVNSTDGIIWEADANTFEFRSVSQSAERMLGYPVRDWTQPGFWVNHIHPDDRDRAVQYCLECTNRSTDHDFEYRFVTRDGQIVWLHDIVKVVSENGKPRWLRGLMIDITSRKQAEAAQAILESQLRESQKMEAIGTLAGGIAHDFNNALAVILGNIELARQDVKGNVAALESLNEIQKAGSRARNLVQQILAFSRRQPTQRKRIDLTQTISDATRLLRATLPARISLDGRCAPDIPYVLADSTQIEQTVINLATNAAYAIPSGPGRISIRLDTVVLDAALVGTHAMLQALNAKYPGHAVRLTISDTGTGMDATTRERIFEPFFTTKPAGEGTGLGLSVVHGIVQGHEGAITVTSEPGKGSTFSVYLPLADVDVSAPVAAPTVAAEAMTQTAAGARHILYVDDDEALVFLVKRLLERNGYRVSAHTDPRTAVAALQADAAAFDLVVTDYNMPEMSGVEVAKTVRTIRPDLPVVVTSGYIDANLRKLAADAGAKEVIFKADEPVALCAAVQRLLQRT